MTAQTWRKIRQMGGNPFGQLATHFSAPNHLGRIELTEKRFGKLFRTVILQKTDHSLGQHWRQNAALHDVRLSRTGRRIRRVIVAERLRHVRLLQETCNRQHITAAIHKHKIEDARHVDLAHVRIVGHDLAEQCGHPLEQRRIVRQTDLDDVRQARKFGNATRHFRTRYEDGLAVTGATRKETGALDENVENVSGQLGLVVDGRALGHKAPFQLRYLLQRTPAVHAAGPATGFRRDFIVGP